MTEYVRADDLEEHVGEVVSLLRASNDGERPRIKASPYIWKDPASIPIREFVYGRHMIRKFLSGTVAPGGVGKSSQALVEAICLATGRDLLGVKIKAPLRVWYWNGEDPQEEIERRVAAICLHYRLGPTDLDGRLFINSGRDCEIVVASETKDGAVVAIPVIQDLRDTITENGIDVWIFDPFVSCHEVSENDNNKIGRVMKALAEVADHTNSAGELVHHVRKGTAGGDFTADDARGAKAFIDRVRSLRALNRMSREEADQLGIPEEERALLFRVDIGKANLAPPSFQAVWRKLQDVDLQNGVDNGPSDHVGVVVAWKAPGVFEGISSTDVLAIQQLVSKGSYRDDLRAANWVGNVVAQALDWDSGEPLNRSRIKEMLRIWTKNGLFLVVSRKDDQRKTKTFVEVGKWIEP